MIDELKDFFTHIVENFGPAVFLILFLLAISVIGATYYADDAAANDAGDGSVGSPKKYIPSAIALMSAGDTVIIIDGTYTGANNAITSLPVFGTSGNWCHVIAETNGGVEIQSTFYYDAGVTSCYYYWRGMTFKSQASHGLSYADQHYKNVGFIGGQVCSSSCAGAVVLMAARRSLYEDCYFAGVGGRYTVMSYEIDSTIFRRCIARRDGGYTFDGSNPEANWSNYGSSYMSYQNCISIDNTLTYSFNIFEGDTIWNYQASFYCTGHGSNPASDSVEFIGCIDLNGQSTGWYCDTDDGGNSLKLTDCISYTNDAAVALGNTGLPMAINRMTAGELASEAIAEWSESITVTNSIFYNHTSAGSGSPAVTYTNTFNPSSFTGTGVTHVNPLVNGLLYLIRIETDSTLKTSGESGGQMGAEVVKRIGTDGTFYGDAGFRDVTETDLWPWPNEARIKTDFTAVSGGDRGFCDQAGTLSDYIIEQLGNDNPYDGSSPAVIHGQITVVR